MTSIHDFRLQAELNSVSLELLELKGVLPSGEESGSKQKQHFSLSNAHITASLEQKVRLLTEEKDNALELATSANNELDQLQRNYKVGFGQEIVQKLQKKSYIR